MNSTLSVLVALTVGLIMLVVVVALTWWLCTRKRCSYSMLVSQKCITELLDDDTPKSLMMSVN